MKARGIGRTLGLAVLLALSALLAVGLAIVAEDTDPPAIIDVWWDTNPVRDADLTSKFVIEFDEPMDTSAVPVIDFGGGTWLSDGVGIWSDGDRKWSQTFTLEDNDEEFETWLDVTGTRDVAGNAQEDFWPEAGFSVDTKAPTVVSVVADPLLLGDGNTQVEVTVTFSEEMWRLTEPVILLSEGTWSASFGQFVPSTSHTTWTETFTLLDENPLDALVLVDVTNAEDELSVNPLREYTPRIEFRVDGVAPTVLSAVISDAFIDQGDVGGTVTVKVRFSEEMISTSPDISFAPDVMTTLELASVSWLDRTTYQAVYDVLDADVIVTSVDMRITDTTDLAGNPLPTYTGAALFDIDTLTPPVTRDVASDEVVLIAPAGEAGDATFLDRCLDLEVGEEPPMVGLHPLAAIYSTGELATGACNLLNASGQPVRGSYVHVYIYTVDVDPRPEEKSLLDHWIVGFDHISGVYSYSWDTTGVMPGYYDLHLSFRDGSSHTCRIQLIAPAAE